MWKECVEKRKNKEVVGSGAVWAGALGTAAAKKNGGLKRWSQPLLQERRPERMLGCGREAPHEKEKEKKKVLQGRKEKEKRGRQNKWWCRKGAAAATTMGMKSRLCHVFPSPLFRFGRGRKIDGRRPQ